MWATAILRLSQEQKRKWFILLVTAFPTPPSIWMFLLWSRQKTKSAPQFRSQIQVTQPVKKWYSSTLTGTPQGHSRKTWHVRLAAFAKTRTPPARRDPASPSLLRRRRTWHPTMISERLQKSAYVLEKGIIQILRWNLCTGYQKKPLIQIELTENVIARQLSAHMVPTQPERAYAFRRHL